MLQSISSKLEKGRKLILIHGNADPDALGCAYAIAKAFPEGDIVAPGGLDRISKIITDKLGIEVGENADFSDYDLVVVVDTSSPDQLENLSDVPLGSVIIDHHARTEKWNGCVYYCDESKRSCAEIVLELVRIDGKELDRDVGLVLLAGMITDSGHFRYANQELLTTFAELLRENELEIDEVFALTDMEQVISERIAQLKGGQRLKFDRIGRYIVAISHGSSFESSVSKSLLSLGADVAFVGSQREDRFRVSARARQEMVRMGLHLGRMLEDIGFETSNDGGGHPGAAGLIGEGDVEAMLNMCMRRTMDFFRKIRDSEPIRN
ncbi:MAG: exopolyphosphatase [Methanomassiliicoccales archaeon]|nr:exopolyphosphatase [Methanomassiliicoccales archaeon]NYT15898.1 exopolyphosphatase [Methanomassiliicoccales archaeon]